MVKMKHYKALFIGAILSSALSMYFGYQFGSDDYLNEYVHLTSKKYNRDIYVSKESSSNLIWVRDTLTFLPK